MTPDDSMLLQNMLDRLRDVTEQYTEVHGQYKAVWERLEGLPCLAQEKRLDAQEKRLRSLEMWRSGLTAVIAFVTVSLGLALNWLKGR